MGIGQLLSRAGHAVASVEDHNIESTKLGERTGDHVADRGGVGDIELGHPESVAVPGSEVGEVTGSTGGRRDPVTSSQRLLAQLTAQSAATASRST